MNSLPIAAMFARGATVRQFSPSPRAYEAPRPGRLRHAAASGLRAAAERLEPAPRTSTLGAR